MNTTVTSDDVPCLGRMLCSNVLHGPPPTPIYPRTRTSTRHLAYYESPIWQLSSQDVFFLEQEPHPRVIVVVYTHWDATACPCATEPGISRPCFCGRTTCNGLAWLGVEGGEYRKRSAPKRFRLGPLQLHCIFLKIVSFLALRAWLSDKMTCFHPCLSMPTSSRSSSKKYKQAQLQKQHENQQQQW